MDTEDFDDLCARYLDGSLSEDKAARFVALLEGSPAHLATLGNQLAVSGALARMKPEQSDEAFLRSVLPHLKSVAEEDEDAFPNRVRNIIRFARWRKIALAAAAVVALVLAVTFTRPKGVVVATLFDESGSRTVSTGSRLKFDKGVARIEFTNGAVVAIEAPAELSITSADKLVLDHGRLNAWCPETAHGFRVITRTATVTDLGTSFGVSATKDGSADVLVLDGKVEVSKGDETRMIGKGSALRSKKGTGFSDVAFEPSGFKRTWPVASGIRSTLGEVVPAPPGTPETLASYENDTHIIVIPERRDFHPRQATKVNITGPGSYEGRRLLEATTFTPPPKTKVRSYLLRYNPVGKLPPKTNKRFEGSVTFDRPVLAVITASGQLHLSDEVFSKTPMPKMSEVDTRLRGLEPSQKLTRSDRVELSADRRTLKVTFVAGESIDEIRAVTSDD